MVAPLKTPLWERAVANDGFRQRLIGDPLRALAEADDVAVTPVQVRQLEEMSLEEREELITESSARCS